MRNFSQEAEFTYGMKELNPITFHYFYKKKPNPEPYRIKVHNLIVM